MAVLCIYALQGCAGSINERNQEEAERWASIWEENPVKVESPNSTPPRRTVVSQPINNQQVSEVDSLLINQEERIKKIETNISALSQHQEDLRKELAAISEENKQDLVDSDAVKNITTSIEPSFSKGIHLASYRTMDNLKVGWQEFINTRHQAILNKEARIVHTTVSGVEYLRLVFGPFSNSEEAKMACDMMKQTISFCDVIDFNGEPLE